MSDPAHKAFQLLPIDQLAVPTTTYLFIFPYIQYPAPMIIAKIIKPISTGANNVTRNTTIATITMNAITQMTMAPIVPNVPIFI
jgi:hypothetical protein